MQHVTAGELLRCPSCRGGISRVANGTAATVRRLAQEADALPGSTVYRCPRCKTFAEIRAEPLAMAA